MENSSQDVSPLEVVRTRVGVIKVEVGFMISETIVDGAGEAAFGDCKLKQAEPSSAVVTEEGEDGGGTAAR